MSFVAYLTLHQTCPIPVQAQPDPLDGLEDKELSLCCSSLLRGVNRRTSHCFSFIRRSESFVWHPRMQPPTLQDATRLFFPARDRHSVASFPPEDQPSVLYLCFASKHLSQPLTISILQEIPGQS